MLQLINDVLGGLFLPSELLDLPLNFVIGYKHPGVGIEVEDTIIFFGGDMPHWVKKFRNAFDNKSRQLTFRGKLMKLSTLKEIWERTESSGSNLQFGLPLTCFIWTLTKR